MKAMDLYEEFTGSNVFVDDPVWAIDFAPNGTRVGAGDVMTRMRYARTLEAVALFGADMLYEGPLAEAIIITSRGNNGTMTMKDLEDYTVVPRRPVEIDYMGYHVYACGAPASGSVTLSALKIMEKYEDCGDNSDDLYIHRMVEAMRFGYGKVCALALELFSSLTDTSREPVLVIQIMSMASVSSKKICSVKALRKQREARYRTSIL